jgi:hypothetical protein
LSYLCSHKFQTVLRIRDVYPGSRIRLFSIPDPNCLHPGSSSRNLSILTPKKPKKWFLISKKYDPGCSSRITDPDADFLSIPDPDPGSRGLKGTQSRIRIPNTGFRCIFFPKNFYLALRTLFDPRFGKNLSWIRICNTVF